MAEALGTVGVIASLIQLTDASIRTCLCLYSFFSALHNSQNEFQRHVIVIRDVHDAIQLVRKTTASQSFSPTEETMISQLILGLIQELSALEKTTASKDPSKLSVRLRWVMKAAETDRILQELERRKTSLILLLQTLTIGKSAQLLGYQDGNRMRLQSLQSLLENQNQQGTATRCDISNRLDALSIKMDSNIQMYKESLEKGFSTLTRDRDLKIPEEILNNVLRSALDSYILPSIEESFLKRSELQYAATLQKVQEMIGNATDQILNQVASTVELERTSYSHYDRKKDKSNERGYSLVSVDARSGNSTCTPLAEDNQIASIPDTTSTCASNRPPISPSTKANKRSLWTSIPFIGTLRIQFETQIGEAGRLWIIQIDFWPSSTFLLRKCISLKYNSSYDQQGYMALFPSLAVYPILSHDNAIWSMIAHDDIDGIKLRFRDRENGPYDHNDYGMSLLSFAIAQCRYGVAQFLLTEGADPTKTTAYGRDCLSDLIYYAIKYAIGNRALCPICCKTYGNDFSLFFPIFHSLIALGCYIDDCDVTIFDFLEDGSFGELPFNQWGRPSENEFMRLHTNENGSSGDGEDSVLRPFGAKRAGSRTVHHDTESILEAEMSYLATIRQLAQFLGRQGLSLVEETHYSRVSEILETPERMTFPVLRECGLNSNYREPFLDELASILYHGLSCLLGDPHSTILMDNLIGMVSGGADIYDMEWATEEWIDDVDHDRVMSPTAYAKAMDLMPVWRYALQRAGYNPDDVILEDEKRRREFQRLHGAASSAVEIEEDTTGSTLRKRRV